ncbi:MAG: colicin D domain-containing protein [Nitrolancea sp.]
MTSVQNAASWSRGSASDYSMAAAWGCATSGSGGSGGSSGGGSSRSSKVKFAQDQLRDKFKHAPDFGVTGNSNPANWEKFREALANVIDNPNTQAIQGTYRGNIPVTFFYDSASKLCVLVRNSNDEFIAGWKLSADQERYLLTTGNVQ